MDNLEEIFSTSESYSFPRGELPQFGSYPPDCDLKGKLIKKTLKKYFCCAFTRERV
jgi:hypothetical protein